MGIRLLFAESAVFLSAGHGFNPDGSALRDDELAFAIPEHPPVVGERPVKGVAQRSPWIGIGRGCAERGVVLAKEPQFVRVTRGRRAGRAGIGIHGLRGAGTEQMLRR